MKIKLDQLLVDRDMVADLKEAQARILAGEVIVDEQRVDKRGQLVEREPVFALNSKRAHFCITRRSKARYAWKFRQQPLMVSFA